MGDQDLTSESLDFADCVFENWLTLGNCPESRKRAGKYMSSDPIADALIRIKNGYRVGKEEVEVSYSKLIIRVMKLLVKEGYIASLEEKRKQLIVSLKYNRRQPALTDITRVSKPSLRVYKGANQLPKVLNGLGMAIISTPKGIMSDKEARKKHLGGEVMALVW